MIDERTQAGHDSPRKKPPSIELDRFPGAPPLAYAEARSQIQSGDLLLCSGSYPFSKLLQLATRSKWSHVALILRLDSIERLMVLESVESFGVRTLPLSKYLTDYDNLGNPYQGGIVIARHRRLSAARPDMSTLTRTAIDGFGRTYGGDHIARIAARILASRLGDEAAAELDDLELPELRGGPSYICSEYVHACFEQVGVDVEFDPRGFISPADFVKNDQLELVAVLQRPPASRSRETRGNRTRPPTSHA